MDIPSILRTLLGMELLQEGVRQATPSVIHVAGDITPDGAILPSLQPGEVRFCEPEFVTSPLHAAVNKLKEQLNLEKLKHKTDHDIAHMLAFDALCALSGAGIGTPEKGYLVEPGCLSGDIKRLARERDEAKKATTVASRHGLRVTNAAWGPAEPPTGRKSLTMIWLNGEAFRVTRVEQ